MNGDKIAAEKHQTEPTVFDFKYIYVNAKVKLKNKPKIFLHLWV
jgi:hypothetical protein